MKESCWKRSLILYSGSKFKGKHHLAIKVTFHSRCPLHWAQRRCWECFQSPGDWCSPGSRSSCQSLCGHLRSLEHRPGRVAPPGPGRGTAPDSLPPEPRRRSQSCVVWVEKERKKQGHERAGEYFYRNCDFNLSLGLFPLYLMFRLPFQPFSAATSYTIFQNCYPKILPGLDGFSTHEWLKISQRIFCIAIASVVQF